ncbi:MAG: gliding motility-associated C-terminal domain-containing protein [Chitinophagaceae bacterium]
MKHFFIFIIIIVSVCHLEAQVNLNAGLMVYLPFNGNTNDASGNGNSATNFGATLTQDQWGTPNSAYVFDGVSDYMKISNNLSLQSQSFSFCVRVKPISFYNGVCFNNVIIAKGGDAGYNTGDKALVYSPTLNQNPTNYCILQDSTHENYRLHAGATGAANSLSSINAVNGIPYVASNNWDCVVGIYNDTTHTASVYVNGVFRYSYVISNSIGTNVDDIFIGKQTATGYPYWMNAVLDEVRIYNRTLNTFEIDSVCNYNPNNILLIDTVHANFSTIYPNPCDSLLIQFNDLSTAINSTITNWNWNFGDGNTSILQNPSHSYTTPGSYVVTLIATNNLNHSDTFFTNITVVNTAPTITATANPSAVCSNNPTTLMATGAVSYTWTGGVVNGVPFVPNATTTYTVTGTDANGCTATSAVTVNVVSNVQVSVSNSQPLLCAGDSSLLVASGAIDYTWSPPIGLNVTNSNSVWANPNTPTTYTVLGTDANGCTGSTSTYVDVVQSINVEAFKNRDVECNNHSIVLTATGAQNYTWTPANILSTPNSGSTNATVNQTTTFYVTGTLGTCIDMDSITVYSYNNDESSIFIPNAFSPNGDGKNDCLKIINAANFLKYYFAIYNRWGELVFEADNPTSCWDGTFRSKPSMQDTYYYYLKAETSCGKILKKGDVILLR